MSHSPIIYLNGNLVEDATHSISVFDSAYQRSIGVFETVAGFYQRLLFWDQHRERLGRSLQDLGWHDRAFLEQLDGQIRQWTKLVQAPKFSLKVIISQDDRAYQFKPNVVPAGTAPGGDSPLQLNSCVIFSEASSLDQRIYRDGMAVKELPNYSCFRGPKSKDVNYFQTLKELRQAVKEGFDDVVFYNGFDEIAEASMANVFFRVE